MRGSRNLASFGGTVLLRQIARRILGPVVEASITSATLAWGSLPLPVDQSRVFAMGPDPDRILYFGAAAVAGSGVSSHELGLCGQFARALSALTGRGTEVQINGQQFRSLSSGTRDLAEIDLSRYDALIIQVGAREAIGLRSLRLWRRDIRALAQLLAVTAPTRLEVFFVGIPPFRTPSASPRSRSRWRANMRCVSISNRARP